MDYILQEGDKLYRTIDTGHQLLLSSDLPGCIHLKDTVFEILRGKEAYGSFVENVTKNKNILVALCTFLQKTRTSALLCIGDKMGSSAITLFSMDTSICVFDAHSRDNSGMPCPNGSSILMHFDNIEHIVSYICQLADSLSAKLFHWTFWHALPDAECHCSSNSLIQSHPPGDILLADDIMKLYHDLVPHTTKTSTRREYYASYRRRV